MESIQRLRNDYAGLKDDLRVIKDELRAITEHGKHRHSEAKFF